VIEVLIANGADTYVQDKRSNTPWCMAQARHDSGAFEVLARDLNFEMCCILGPPGSGKSSQSLRLEQAFDFHVLTLDKCLETACKYRPGIMRTLQELSEQGKGQVPAWLIATALRTCLEMIQQNTVMSTGATSHRVCLDGFPSSLEEAMEIEKVVGTPRYVMVLETSYQDAMRRMCLDVSGKRISEEVTQRASAAFKAFPTMFKPLVEHYEAQGNLRKFRSSNTDGIMKVFNEIKMLYGVMEANAIMANITQKREMMVTIPIQQNRDTVAKAKLDMTNLRKTTAAAIRASSRKQEATLKLRSSMRGKVEGWHLMTE